MRFGKTFATYQLAQRIGWKRMLVLTYKPAVRRLPGGTTCEPRRLRGLGLRDREHRRSDPSTLPTHQPLVWFASFQDLLGQPPPTERGRSTTVDLHLIDWDCLVVDEYHFGAWQGAAKEVCQHQRAPVHAPDWPRISRRRPQPNTPRRSPTSPRPDAAAVRRHARSRAAQRTSTRRHCELSTRRFLYLSGTPFRALTEGEFNEDAIFNWTYPDEQARR